MFPDTGGGNADDTLRLILDELRKITLLLVMLTDEAEPDLDDVEDAR